MPFYTNRCKRSNPPHLAYVYLKFALVVRALSNFTLDFYKRLQSLCSTFPNLHNRKQLSVLDVTNARSKALPICIANARARFSMLRTRYAK